MRISDWSSDVCSSDLVSFLASECDGGADAGVCLSALRHHGEGRGVPAGAPLAGHRRNRGMVLAPRAGRLEHLRAGRLLRDLPRSEEHTSELQSLMRISYAVFCWKKKTQLKKTTLN